MTRTEQLGLYTWVESDPVSLTQMNENFTQLDTVGAQALARANAAGINAAGLLLHSRHAGQDISFAQDVMAADLTRVKDAAAYSQLMFSSAGAHLLASGYSGVTENIRNSDGTNISVSSSNSPRKIWTIKPSGFGALSSVTVTMTTGAYSSFTDQILLYCGGTLVAESDEYVKTDINTSQSEFTYTFDGFVLDPNKTYDLYFKTTYSTLRHISSATITATPLVYTTGNVISNEIILQAGHTRAAFYAYTSGNAPDVMVKLGDGSFESVVEKLSKQAVSQTGVSCTARRYEYEFLPGTYESITIKLEMSGADSVVYGFFGAIL